MTEFVRFNIIPSSEIEKNKQVLLKERKHHFVADYEGIGGLADALFIRALAKIQNIAGEVPMLLVNQNDFESGMYGDFEHEADS